MIDSPDAFAQQLNQIDRIESPRFSRELADLISQTSAATLAQAYPAIFRPFEAYPDVQMLGTFLQIFDDIYPAYLDELIQSVERTPSTNTLLMVNRILNDNLVENIRDRLITCLRDVDKNRTATSTCRKEAAHYLRRQEHLDWQHLRLPINDRSASDQTLVTDSVRAIEGRYAILRGRIVPTAVIPIEPTRFGLMAEDQSAESWMSIPMHLMVAVELPKHLRVFFHDSPIVVEGELSIDLQRNSNGIIQTVYKIMAERIVRPAD